MRVHALLFALLVAWPAAAEELWPPKAFKCLFVGGVAVELKQDFSVDVDKGMAFAYASVDAAKGTAQMIGNVGAVDVTVINTPRGLHLIEVTEGGNFTTTTVFPRKEDSPDFWAVHSRHMMIGENIVVSQFHGTCKGLW